MESLESESDYEEPEVGVHIVDGRKIVTYLSSAGLPMPADITLLIPYQHRVSVRRQRYPNIPPHFKLSKVSKWAKFQTILALHKWHRQYPLLRINPHFIRHYSDGRSSVCKVVQSVCRKTLQNWDRDFAPNTPKFNKLREWIRKTPHAVSNKVIRFFNEPLETHCGLCPVFETFLAAYRTISAQECHSRSTKWLVQEGRRVLKCKQIMSLLTPLMDDDEKEAIPLLKVTKYYIFRIIACQKLIQALSQKMIESFIE